SSTSLGVTPPALCVERRKRMPRSVRSMSGGRFISSASFWTASVSQRKLCGVIGTPLTRASRSLCQPSSAASAVSISSRVSRSVMMSPLSSVPVTLRLPPERAFTHPVDWPPMRSFRVVTAAALLAAAAGCATPPSESAPAAAPATTRATPEPSPTPTPTPEPDLPSPGERIPKDPAKLAAALEETTAALAEAIGGWDKKQAPPADVELLALYHQRIYRFAARNPDIAEKAFARLPRRLASEARGNTHAIRELLALAHPVKSASVIRTRDARPAAELLRYFKQAERRFGVDWEVLAAVMFAETKFGRVRSASHVGAQGPMQFMPATWKAYGMGGDVQDHRDSVMAA